MGVNELLMRFRHKPEYFRAECGHNTKTEGLVTAFGVTAKMTIIPNQGGSFNYCLDCLEKMAIKCSWCSDPIFPGNSMLNCSVGERHNIPGCAKATCRDTAKEHKSCEVGVFMPGDNGRGYFRKYPNITIIGRSTKELPCKGACKERLRP